MRAYGPHEDHLTARKADTDRKAKVLRSARFVTGHLRSRSVADRIVLDLRSVRGAYGPQRILLTVRRLSLAAENGQMPVQPVTPPYLHGFRNTGVGPMVFHA